MVGESEIYIDGDLVMTVGRGQCTAEVIRALSELLDPVFARHEHVFLITDVSQTRGFDADARRLIVKWNNRRRPAASALYGSSFVVRTMLMLINRAVSLLFQAPNTAIFATEAEARSWIDAQRRQLKERQRAATAPG